MKKQDQNKEHRDKQKKDVCDKSMKGRGYARNKSIR